MAIEMKFNNFLITQLINIVEVIRNPFPKRTINNLSIPSRNGEIFQNAYFGSGEIEIKYNIVKEYRPTFDGTQIYDSQFNNYVRSLAFYLNTDEPAPLILSDEPNKFYYAICESIDIERTMQYGEGSMKFICADPFAYALEEKVFDVENKNVSIENYGTALSYPTFETTFTKNATNLTIVSTQGIVQIGDVESAGKENKAVNTTLLLDTCDTVSSWIAGSQTMLSLTATRNKFFVDPEVGLMTTNGNLMLNVDPTVDEENIDENGEIGYTGGYFIKNLSEPANYWRVKEHFNFSSRKSLNDNSLVPEQMGCIAIIGYDVNNAVLFDFIMHDNTETYEYNVPSLYLGASTLVWQGKATKMAKGTTKRYANVVITDDEWELPKNANLIMETETKYYTLTTVIDKAPIRNKPSDSGAVITAVPKGSTFVEKRSVTGTKYFEIYLTEDKTTTGYIKNSFVNQEDGGTYKTVTYEETTYPTSGGKWDDFSGSITIECKPYSARGTGRVWKATLWKNKWGTGKVEQSYSKTWYDPTGGAYTNAGALAKIGIFLGTKEQAEMVYNTAVRQIEITKYPDVSTDDDVYLIAKAGDTIEVDCGEGMVYKNGEPFMEEVDVGSDFFGVPPMTKSDVKVITDDANSTTKVTIRERYI